MSKAQLFQRHARRCLDRAISSAYEQLGLAGRIALDQLLHAVRAHSDYLRPRKVFANRFAEVAVLRNLALWRKRWMRRPLDWVGDGGLHTGTASLAEHLLTSYPVPRFLTAVWFGEALDNEVWRGRYIEHGQGTRFRDLGLPMQMNRSMERAFIQTPDHFPVKLALRRAELLALGAELPLVELVLQTHLGECFEHGEFWRTVLRFFVRHQQDVLPADVSSIVSFLRDIRFEPIQVETLTGTHRLSPPEPDFSMKGRTLASMRRRVAHWKKIRGHTLRTSHDWLPLGLRPFQFQAATQDSQDAFRWEFVELTNSHQLVAEGHALGHCVGEYSNACVRGDSRIFSLRKHVAGKDPYSVMTVEIDPSDREVVQAQGHRNRSLRIAERELLLRWVQAQELKVADWVLPQLRLPQA